MNSGVYQIENLMNGKVYIGSSQNISKRWATHISFLNGGIHSNKHLQNAWNLYGKENFKFTIIEECRKEFLLDREQHSIDTVEPEYNIYIIAGSPRGIKQSTETCAKISVSLIGNTRGLGYKHTPKARAKISVAGKGRLKSAETCAKLSVALTGRKLSPETRAKISAAKIGRKQSPETCARKSIAMKGNTNGFGYKHFAIRQAGAL